MPRQTRSPSPLPAPFAFVTGDFDYPRATIDQVRPYLYWGVGGEDEWRRILHRDDSEQLNRQSSTGNELTMSSPRPRVAHSSRQTPANEAPSLDTSGTLAALSALSANGRRRTSPAPQRPLRRSLARLRGLREDIQIMDDIADILGPPGDVSSLSPHRSSAFESAFSAAHARIRTAADELDCPTRRTKRRKVDHVSENSNFKYGYKGQVVPGRLRMEIVSYDGGEYPHRISGGRYPIENVLKKDKSVYCSERSRCNILLKHIGEAPFTLEKVVIRAPDRGYTAPVQEGLIFVAMSSEDIISGTSSYKIEYDSESPATSPRPEADDQLLSLHEALNDPYIWDSYRQGVEDQDMSRLRRLSRRLRVEDSGRTDDDSQIENYRSERALSLYSQLAEACEDPATDDFPATAGVSAPTPPPFTISTESEEETDEDEEPPSAAATMADRLRRESRWHINWDDASAGHLESIRARESPSRIEPKDGSIEPERVIVPNAKFFIAKHKSKITIKFHPAISGKYVLLKLWSPTHDGNIDIESVQFYGYSGPRFFPAIQFA